MGFGWLHDYLKDVFLKNFLTPLSPSGSLSSKQFQKTLILAFEANSALSRENKTKIVKIIHSADGRRGQDKTGKPLQLLGVALFGPTFCTQQELVFEIFLILFGAVVICTMKLKSKIICKSKLIDVIFLKFDYILGTKPTIIVNFC